MPWQILIAAAVALWLFGKNLPQALLFLFPGLLRARETEDDGSLDPAREPAMERVVRGLGELGFSKIGAIEARPPLSRGFAEQCWAAPALGTFADVSVREGEVAVTLLTPFPGGAAVATSDFRRPGVDWPDYVAGGLDGMDVPELWAVHRRRIDHFPAAKTAALWTDFSLAGRLLADAAIKGGPGRRETRRRAAAAFVIALVALALSVTSFLQLARLVGR